MRILVIEDEPQLARHLTRSLILEGHEAETRSGGETGLQAALEQSPDLRRLGPESASARWLLGN
jgi:DNA-binding response OmpR family regulator